MVAGKLMLSLNFTTSKCALIIHLCSLVIARFDVSLALQQEQCKSSCHSALAQSRISSNGNLASSALDAMFSIRDYEDGEDEIREDRSAEPSTGRVMQNSEQGTTSPHYSSRTRERGRGNVNESYRNLGYRPKRLPPLIETLVGNIDGDGSRDGHQRGNPGIRKRARIIPEKETKDTKNNRGGTEYAGQQPRQNDKYQYYTGDDVDSVAMVAAAAATAVWSSASSQTSRWGSLRMRAYDDEWEEALRWISTWGPPNQQEQEQHRQYDEGRRHSRSKVGQHRVKQKGYDDVSITKSFSELHEICVKRCLGDEWEWDPHSEPTTSLSEKREIRKSSPYKGSKNNRVPNFLELIGIGGILSPRIFARISMFLMQIFTFNSTREAFLNVFGVILSGAMICFSRYVYQWWALNRYTTSLQSLLKEEAEKNCVKGKQGKKSNHSGRKKMRQRKKHRVVRGRGKDTQMASSPDTKNETKWRTSSDDDDSDSDDSLDPFYLLHGKRHHSNTIDSNSDQASKETMETASCTTIDSGRLQVAGSQGSSQLDTRGNRKYLQPKSLDMKIPDACDKAGNTNYVNCTVPTDAQREQSYQALKAFQRAQLLKLIEDIKKEKAVRKDKERVAFPVNGTPSPCKTIEGNISLENKDAHLPPPGLSTNTTSGGTKLKKSFTDALLGTQPKEKSAVDIMLSRLLDDGEDDIDIDAASSTSENRKTAHNEFKRTHEQNQVRPVALGDLLLGTFGGDASNKTFVTQPKSNPWQKNPESFGISGLKDDISSGQEDLTHSESTDANIQLQVSASEFMPKWGEGTHASENNRIW